MKKLIAMLLCFAMFAAFGATAAFADLPDPNSAYQYTRWSYSNRWIADNLLKPGVSLLDKMSAYVKAYEAVKYDSSKSEDQVKAAKDKLQDQLVNLFDDNYDGLVNFIWLYDTEKDRIAVWNSILTLFDADTTTSTRISSWKKYIQTWEAENRLRADRQDVHSDYYLSSGTKMDLNKRDIGLAKLKAAYDLTVAQAAAANAKVNALVAQATAKALIADSIKVAQDAAATAIANAQAEAYSTLASNYADAVEAFWGEVALAWGF